MRIRCTRPTGNYTKRKGSGGEVYERERGEKEGTNLEPGLGRAGDGGLLLLGLSGSFLSTLEKKKKKGEKKKKKKKKDREVFER